MALRDRLLVKIGDRRYPLDFPQTSIMPIPVTREQLLSEDAVGDRALTGGGLWQISQRSWEGGAGQDYLGDDDTDRLDRFDDAEFINPWVRRGLTLQPELNIGTAKTGTPNYIIYGGASRIYWFDGVNILFGTTPGDATPSWSTITLNASDVVEGMVANDDYLYYAKRNGSTFSLNRAAVGSTTTAAFGALTPTDGPWLCHGRLLAADRNRLYEVDSAGAVAVGNLDYTHPLDDWLWTHAVETPNGIYAAGWHSNNRSDKAPGIYYIGIDATDGSLVEPVLATPLPVGEQPYSLGFSGGYVLIGTSLGFRVAIIDTEEKLRHGKLIEINGGCRDFAPYGQYVWTTYLNSDSDAGGAARIDLGNFIDEQNLVPAWAPDRMRAGSNAYGTSVYVDAGEVYILINGVGFCNEVTAKAATGNLTTSVYDFNTFEPKAIIALDFSCEPLPAGSTIVFEIAGDDGSFSTVTTYSTTGGTGPLVPITVSAFSAEPQRQVRLRITLTRATATASAPQLREWRLYAAPAPFPAKELILALRLSDRSTDDTDNVEIAFDTLDDWEFLLALEETREVVDLEVGGWVGFAHVTGVGIPERGIMKWNDAEDWFDATVLVRLITVDVPTGEVIPDTYMGY